MLRTAVIGCGRIAQNRHLPEYAQQRGSVLLGVYDRTPERAWETARRWGVRAYDSLEELLSDPWVDALSLCTANLDHAPTAIRALRAGKHVLCEKPMALTWEDCRELLKAQGESGRRLMIAQNQRLQPEHLTARQLLREGAIGRVLSFRSIFAHSGPDTWTPAERNWFFRQDAAGLGALGDLGVHKVDLIRFLLGQEVHSVSAVLGTLDKRLPDGQSIPVEDNALCLLEMTGGALGSVSASWTCYGSQEGSTVLYGTKGVLRLCEDPAHPLVLERLDGERIFPDFPARGDSGVVEEFLSAIRENRPSPLDAEDVSRSMQAVFAAMQAAKEGRTVLLPQPPAPFF